MSVRHAGSVVFMAESTAAVVAVLEMDSSLQSGEGKSVSVSQGFRPA